MFPKRAWKIAKYSRVGGSEVNADSTVKDVLRCHFCGERERERKDREGYEAREGGGEDASEQRAGGKKSMPLR